MYSYSTSNWPKHKTFAAGYKNRRDLTAFMVAKDRYSRRLGSARPTCTHQKPPSTSSPARLSRRLPDYLGCSLTISSQSCRAVICRGTERVSQRSPASSALLAKYSTETCSGNKRPSGERGLLPKTAGGGGEKPATAR